MTTHIPVVIIGGGIAGLSASLFLSQNSIRHILVERHPTTSIHPRSRGVNARTMELFRSLGIAADLREAGRNLEATGGMYEGSSSLVEIIESKKRTQTGGPMRMPGAAYFEAASPESFARGTQDFVEPVLLRFARERGGDCRFFTECVGFEQDEGWVNVTLRDRETEKDEVVRADFVIASDGAGSPVREKLGVKTTGRGEMGHLLNILFRADLSELVRGRWFSLMTIDRPEVLGLFTSINNSDRWVFHLSYDPAKGEKPEDFTHERCKELLRIAIGIPDLDIEIKSVLPWKPAVKVAEKLQHGRIFLAGDAAHVMPPWRGQGATSGIADVHNLAWKIAAVLNGKAAPKLLETYDVERLPVGKRAAEESGAAGDSRGLVSMKKSIPMILRAIGNISMMFGFGYTYASNAIVSEAVSWSKLLRWSVPWSISSLIVGLDGSPGTRAPHVWVQHEGKRTSTLDLFGKDFVMITGSQGKPWSMAAEDVTSKLGVEVRTYRAGPNGDLSDPRFEWEYAAGISPGGALLVRPDGFIAWRVYDLPGNPKAELESILRKVLCL